MAFGSGFVVGVLGITREQFCYWRRQFDPIPHRKHFNYQLLLAYAVLQEMIENRWLRPRLLKEIDFSPFFEWFEVKHSERELKQVVIEIDRTQATLAIHLRGRSTYQTPEVPNEQIEKITLHIVESRLLKRFKNIH